MSSSKKGRSIMAQVLLDIAEKDLADCHQRLEAMERNLRFKPMTNEEREKSEKDVAELKRILVEQEQELRKLRAENRASTGFAVILMIAAFLIFGLYHMFIKND